MKLGHTICLPNGHTLNITTVCGRRYFQCAFPEIAEKYDGCGDDEVCAAIDEWEMLALGRVARAEQQPKESA